MNAPLYIPSHTKCKNCGACCGLVPASSAEYQEIKKYLEKHPEIKPTNSNAPYDCLFRDEKNHRCSIYPVRPIMCRLFGVAAGEFMRCKHGNSAEIDGRKFLDGHTLDDNVILNYQNWGV